MGDRTYASITISGADTTRFDLASEGFMEENVVNGLVTFSDSEANYGGIATLERLREHGVCYVGYHDSGGSYGGEVFAFDGKEFVEAMAHQEVPGPVIEVHASGPDTNQLTNALRYWQVYHRARAKMIRRSRKDRRTVGGLRRNLATESTSSG